ncbi:MAG: hypothetical protein ACRDQ0_18990, partial [Pseudonocardia sp.]
LALGGRAGGGGGGRPGPRIVLAVEGWWPAVVAVVAGLVVLAIVCMVVARRVGRTGRALARLRADVQGSRAELQTSLAHARDRATGMGRIRSVPTKGG